MEENNNNNIIIKGLAIILIAILGLNVYRTETTKKEMAQLATTLEQLSAQLDSLGVVGAPVSTVPAASGVSKIEFSTLSKSVSALESKITTLQGTISRLSRNQKQSGEIYNLSSSSTKSAEASCNNGRVMVNAKVKVDNRYVYGTTFVPKVSTSPAGVVVINVVVNRLGTVGSVSVNSSSTIKDEDILDACKEAALKTDFAYNPEAPDKTRGTITYTFTAK